MSETPRVGVQSVVYADRSLDALLAELESVAVETLELWTGHLAPDDGEETIAAAEAALADADVSVVGYGVVDVGAVGEVRPYAAIADRLGADYLTVNYPPGREDVTEELLAVGDEFDLAVAIHNYSTVHHDDLDAVFSSIDDIVGVLDDVEDSRLGACVDTGHFLVMDQAPEHALERLAGRVHAVHLKDTSAAELEDLPGAGALGLDAVVGLLAAHDALDVPLLVEYELDTDRATVALREALGNVNAVLDRKV